MAILHEADISEIEHLVGNRIAAQIEQIRTGKITIHTGGGGRYGKISE